jgi:hypothetical protein
MTATLRTAIASIVLGTVCLVVPARLAAHRLDEYLQAARLAVARDRVSVELDLTAGIAKAPAVFAMIDANHDGRVSQSEIDAYARQVADALVLTLDGETIRPVVDRAEMPAWSEMRDGVGAIRLHASARIPAARPGHHQLFFRNTHQPAMSVYLANALVPEDDRVEITSQGRDADQHELTIDYRVTPAAGWSAASSWQFLAGLAVAGAVALVFWSRPRTRRLALRRPA